MPRCSTCRRSSCGPACRCATSSNKSHRARQLPASQRHRRRALRRLCRSAARRRPGRAPPSRRRAHDQDHARADGAGRLGRDLRGHHRAPSRRGEHRAHGAPRRADRICRTACCSARRWPRAWRASEPMGETMAVFCLDLDNFKGVNDTLGHPIGDKLLGTIAERIRGAVGEGDTVARLGGDEFAVLQRNSSPEAAGALARRLVEIISEPIEIDGQEINSGVSIGIALAPNDGNAGRPSDEMRRPRALPRQGGRARHVPLLRAGHGRAHPGAPRARSRPAPRARGRRVLARLSAADQSRRQRARRHGGAAALEPCGARAGAAVRVHSARRGNGPDRAARRMGAARGLQRGRALARPDQGRGQPLAGAVPQPRAGRRP